MPDHTQALCSRCRRGVHPSASPGAASPETFPVRFPCMGGATCGYGWLHLHRFHMHKPTFLAVQLQLEPRGVNRVCRGSLGKQLHRVCGGGPGDTTKPPGARGTSARNKTGSPMATGQGDKFGEWCNMTGTCSACRNKMEFFLPGQLPVPASAFPCTWMRPLCCPPWPWDQRAAGRSPGTKSLANATFIATTMPWPSPTCFQLQRWLPGMLQRWLPGTLQPILNTFLMLWS